MANWIMGFGLSWGENQDVTVHKVKYNNLRWKPLHFVKSARIQVLHWNLVVFLHDVTMMKSARSSSVISASDPFLSSRAVLACAAVRVLEPAAVGWGFEPCSTFSNSLSPKSCTNGDRRVKQIIEYCEVTLCLFCFTETEANSCGKMSTLNCLLRILWWVSTFLRTLLVLSRKTATVLNYPLLLT